MSYNKYNYKLQVCNITKQIIQWKDDVPAVFWELPLFNLHEIWSFLACFATAKCLFIRPGLNDGPRGKLLLLSQGVTRMSLNSIW